MFPDPGKIKFLINIFLNESLSRFLPVKKTSDLLLVMSNLYNLDHGSLIMSPKVNDHSYEKIDQPKVTNIDKAI